LQLGAVVCLRQQQVSFCFKLKERRRLLFAESIVVSGGVFVGWVRRSRLGWGVVGVRALLSWVFLLEVDAVAWVSPADFVGRGAPQG